MTKRKTARSSFWRHNGLSITLIALLLASLVGQIGFGWQALNDELAEHQRAPMRLGDYLTSGHFVSATFENWESEFLQMGLYVWLTAFLYQRGSAESRPLDEEPTKGEKTPLAQRPWPMRREGIVRWLYENSLSLAFLTLFLMSFALHLWGSWRQHVLEQQLDGQPGSSLSSYLLSAQPWFESFQNWQSEFLAVLSIVVLSIFLRQKGSSQSKHVNAPHDQTGD
jgi:hypothetical protein